MNPEELLDGLLAERFGPATDRLPPAPFESPTKNDWAAYAQEHHDAEREEAHRTYRGRDTA